MSFTSMPPPASFPFSSASASSSSRPPSSPSSPSSELYGILRALRANTAGLNRLASARPFDVRRVRALRAQSRELAAAAAACAEAPARANGSAAKAASKPSDDVEEVVPAFAEALRRSVAAERAAVLSGGVLVGSDKENGFRGEKGYGATGSTAPVQLQVQGERENEAVMREVRGNAEMVREREAALKDVQASVVDVNAIFVDLASMVGEQGETVEYVELELGNARENVARAKRELERGVNQRDMRKKLFFMTLLCVALVFAILLVLILD